MQVPRNRTARTDSWDRKGMLVGSGSLLNALEEWWFLEVVSQSDGVLESGCDEGRREEREMEEVYIPGLQASRFQTSLHRRHYMMVRGLVRSMTGVFT